ncbi:Octopamine receptor [Holothuria leucospilota]|uniref:Octopamine receptor n=1 Tax=Holothuria leucospilota TaxID=206669 RepID=A0A9Q1C6I3_HOLLE|nr:Octopamine receptor [Holothuria leucospilota]
MDDRDRSTNAATVITNNLCKSFCPISAGDVTLVAITLAMGIITLCGNGFVLVAYFTSKKLSATRKTTQNVYILNLAIADFGVGLVVMLPYSIHMLICKRDLPFWVLLMWNTSAQALLYERLYLTVLCSYDRYLLVSDPVRYRCKETPKRAWIRCAVIWVLNLVLALGTEVWFMFHIVDEGICADGTGNPWKHYHLLGLGIEWMIVIVFLMDFCIPFCLLILCNCLVFVKLRKQVKKKLHENQLNFSHNELSCDTEAASERNEEQCPAVAVISDGQLSGDEKTDEGHKTQKNKLWTSNESFGRSFHREGTLIELNKKTSGDLRKFNELVMEKRARREYGRVHKAALRLLLFVIVLAVCWLPPFIVGIISAFKEFPEELQSISRITTTILWSNSAIDPFLYSAMNRHFQTEIHRQLKWRPKCQR